MLQIIQLSVRLLQQTIRRSKMFYMKMEDFLVPLTPPNLLQFISAQRDKIIHDVIAQIELVLLVMSLVSITAIITGLIVWKSSTASEIVTGFWSIVFTIPSLAMFIFFIGPFGLGWLPAVIALVLYGQLPVVRNTIVGLRSVEPAVMESAAAMGMKPFTVLRKIQFPLAWPVIIVGIRVSAMLIFGISAIAAYVGGPGLGDYLFSGLANLGSFNSMNQTLVGAFGITLLALLFDGVFVLIRRVTTPRGLRV
jgi:osmoprotectant transport system permease protein